MPTLKAELYHPFLISEKIYLRGLEESDLKGNYFQWFNDQSNDEFTTHALFPNNMEKMRDYYEKTLNDKILLLAIIYKEDNKHVGNISLYNFDWINRRAKFAIIIGEKKYHNQGIGTNATRLIVDHGFKRLNLNSIYLDVHAENKGAIRAYEKVGFKQQGRVREWWLRDDKYNDNLIMNLLRSDYLKEGK